MKKQNLLKSIILVITVLFSTVQAFASTSVVQTFTTSAPLSVVVEKKSGSTETATVNPETGVHTGLFASFNFETNGVDDNFSCIMLGSKLTAYDGEIMNAFSDDGKYLLFAWNGENDEYYPTVEAIEDAKSGGSNNPNVIAYEISDIEITSIVDVPSPMTISYDSAQETTEGTVGCYVVKLNGGTSATFTPKIDTNPLKSSFSSSQDMAGAYKAVVYFTAVSQ